MNKIDKWLFPFLGSDGKEVTEVQRYYTALAQNEDGFYPIGANGLWHGGIHFAAGSGQALKQGAGIRCIADGEVVAYRLNKSYPAVVYPGDAEHPAKYSSGFVLVRHKLVLPPEPPAPVPAGTTPPAAPVTPGTAPATTPAAPTTPAEPPAADILTFYSLYMHVLNADAYEAHPGLDRPVHWAGPAGNKYKVGSKAKDTEPTLAPGKTGIRVRDAQKKVIGLLPQGDIIKLGAALAAHPTYFAVDAAYAGTVHGREPVDSMHAGRALGYVFKAELDPLNAPDPAALNAIYILPTPKAVKAGDLLGHLGEYQNYQDVTHHPSSRPLLHLEVFSGDDVPAFIARSKARSAKLDAKTKTRLHIHAGARLFEPTPSDLAIPAGTRLIETADSPKSGLWVKATQMVKAIVARNSLTDYKAGTGTSKGSYKHGGKRVEFTGRFFGPTDADVTTDETVRKNLGYNRREIMMPTGEPLWLERSALTRNTLRSGWKNFPLQLSKPSGNVTVLSRVYTRGELDKRPANQVAIDDHNVRWFKHSANGWICEKGNPGVEWESSWDWSGFEVVKETSTPAEHFVRNPHILNAALPNESHNFQQRADAADSTGIFKKVREIMDGIDQSRPDGKLSVSEFKRALKTPWLADQVGRLIVNYESEWGGAATKWDELDSVMLDGVLAWKAEKIRIANLSFWNGLRGVAGFPAPQVYHFHPVGLVGNFVESGCKCTSDITDEQLQIISPATSKALRDKYLPYVNAALNKYEINSCINRAHFLAQMLHESGGFRLTREGSNDVLTYDPWRGRGLIQITYENNYKKYGIFVGEDFTSNSTAMKKLEEVPHSVTSAVWYWEVFKDCSLYGKVDDFIWVTILVNGGLNGYDDRLIYLNNFIRAIDISDCAVKNKEGVYHLKDSHANNSLRGSFAWGLWSDPGSRVHGKTKNKDQAIIGYKRYLELWVGKGRPAEDKLYGYVKPSDHATSRLEALNAV